MVISLSDLKMKRALMDRAAWLLDEPGSHTDYLDIWCSNICVAKEVPRLTAGWLVGMQAAADVLIEVVSAALEWQAALEERRQFGASSYYKDPFGILTLEHRSARAKLDAQIRDRTAALHEALAKVLP